MDETRKLIEKLNDNIPPKETADILKKAQKYSAGLYVQNGKKMYELVAPTLPPCGATVLCKEHYSEGYEVTLEGGYKELLMY